MSLEFNKTLRSTRGGAQGAAELWITKSVFFRIKCGLRTLPALSLVDPLCNSIPVENPYRFRLPNCRLRWACLAPSAQIHCRDQKHLFRIDSRKQKYNTMWNDTILKRIFSDRSRSFSINGRSYNIFRWMNTSSVHCTQQMKSQVAAKTVCDCRKYLLLEYRNLVHGRCVRWCCVMTR